MHFVYGKMVSHDARKRLSTVRGDLLALLDTPLSRLSTKTRAAPFLECALLLRVNA